MSVSRRRSPRRRPWWRRSATPPASSCAERPSGRRTSPSLRLASGASARGDEDADDDRVAVYLQDAHPIREGMEIARYAEDEGSTPSGRPRAGWCGRRRCRWLRFVAVTDRIKVGSGVVNNWTRNPALLASTFSTLDDLAPGRVILGIGAWWEPLAGKVGRAARRSRCRAMREMVDSGPGAAGDETVTYDGEFVHLDGVELDYVHQERRPKDVPDLHRRDRDADDGAGRRDRRRRGAQLPGVAGLQRPGAGAPGDRGAPGRAARRPTSTGPQLVVCSLDADRGAALDAARLLVTQYLGQQPHIMKASGVPESLLDDIGEVLTWPATHEQVEAASRLVPDEVVQLITASGTPEECRAKVAEYVERAAAPARCSTRSAKTSGR